MTTTVGPDATGRPVPYVLDGPKNPDRPVTFAFTTRVDRVTARPKPTVWNAMLLAWLTSAADRNISAIAIVPIEA